MGGIVSLLLALVLVVISLVIWVIPPAFQGIWAWHEDLSKTLMCNGECEQYAKKEEQ
jgi:ABC-type microcin C transport system permease subunit YejE